MKAQKQNGFTLIELIMVIAVLGILAAFAIPKFADLSSDARKAAIQGAAASIKSASAIAHSAYLADGSSPASVTMEGAPVALAFGYPTAASIVTAAQISSTDFTVDTTGPTTVRAIGAATPANCGISYTAAADATTPPVITVDVTDC